MWAEASPRQERGWGADGGHWVGGELSPGLGPGVGFPGVLGPRAAASKSAGSGLWAPASAARAPGAGAACPGPVGLGLRAAGRGEENNRRGGREQEGAGARDAGPTPPGPAPRAGGHTARGPLGPRDQGKAQAPGPGGSQALQPILTAPLSDPGAGQGSGNPWRPGCQPSPLAGRTCRHQRPNGWASQAPAPRPY